MLRVVIVRREPGGALSMDVYADGLVAGLKAVRSEWTIVEIAPTSFKYQKSPWPGVNGLRKYYERFWRHPWAVTRQPADIVHIIDHTSGHVVRWLKKPGQSVVVSCHDLVQLIYPENYGQTVIPQISLAAWRFSVRGMKQNRDSTPLGTTAILSGSIFKICVTSFAVLEETAITRSDCFIPHTENRQAVRLI